MATIEVTEKQKAKIVDIMAREKEQEDVSLKEVDLLQEHRINGVPYGPGRTMVPSNIAGTLLSNDQAAIQSRLREMTSQTGMREILGRGITRMIKGGF